MEPDSLTALETEKNWEADGTVVLTAGISLPQLAPRTRRERRFNRYYRRILRAFLLYCEHETLPEAAGRFRAAAEASRPFEARRVTLRFAVRYRDERYLSLTLDAQEDGLTIRRADTWDLAAGLPVPLSEWFPPRTHCRARLLRFARTEALRRAERGEAELRQDYRLRLRRALNTRNYFLSESGLVFFYPMYAVAGAAEGVVAFTMPYDERCGPFPPGRPQQA